METLKLAQMSSFKFPGFRIWGGGVSKMTKKNVLSPDNMGQQMRQDQCNISDSFANKERSLRLQFRCIPFGQNVPKYQL